MFSSIVTTTDNNCHRFIDVPRQPAGPGLITNKTIV